MKKFFHILPALAIGLLSVSCSMQDDAASVKKDATPSAALTIGSGIMRPSLQCGTADFSDLVSISSGITAGNVEIVNDRDNVYLLFTMADDLVLSDISIFYGNIGDMPVSGDGSTLQVEAFPYRLTDASNSAQFTYSLPASAAGCDVIALSATVQHMDFMGNVWGAETVWLDGNPMLNGMVMDLCLDVCPPAASGIVGSSL